MKMIKKRKSIRPILLCTSILIEQKFKSFNKQLALMPKNISDLLSNSNNLLTYKD